MDENVLTAPSVAYVYSSTYARYCDVHERNKGRASLVHNTVKAYGLFREMRVVEPRVAGESDLLAFHSRDYLGLMKRVQKAGGMEAEWEGEAEEAGLSHDCPLLPSTWNYVRLVAGATLTLVQMLVRGEVKRGINWGGGWHHAAGDRASGFCYVNDCVLAILALRDHFPRVLYIDLDAHHGDGVEEAFASSPKVMTLSIHHKSPGFFPGSGGVEEVGLGRGKYATLNIPLQEGLSDAQFIHILRSVLPAARARFEPGAVVVQCGADGLARDPIGAFNLTPAAFTAAFSVMEEWAEPMLILGGGGYQNENTARAWTAVTNALLRRPPLHPDIPDTHPNFLDFAPDYSLDMAEGKIRNMNKESDIDHLLTTIHSHLDNLP